MRAGLVLICACWGCGGGGSDPGAVTVEFFAPDEDIRRFEGEILEIRFRVDDPSGGARTTIRAVPENPGVAPKIVIATARPSNGGAVQSVFWDTAAVVSETYTIEAETRNLVLAEAAGQIDLRPQRASVSRQIPLGREASACRRQTQAAAPTEGAYSTPQTNATAQP